LQGLPKPPQEFRNAISLDSWQPLTSLFTLDPMDELYTDSRILRRQMKRLRKLQERERESENNRRLNMVMHESRKEASKRKKEIQDQIKEDTDIFVLENDTTPFT
jgi:hypothetical protein